MHGDLNNTQYTTCQSTLQRTVGLSGSAGLSSASRSLPKVDAALLSEAIDAWLFWRVPAYRGELGRLRFRAALRKYSVEISQIQVAGREPLEITLTCA